MPSFMAAYDLIHVKLLSLLGEDLTDYFTWLQLHENNDEHRQQRETSIQHFYFQHALIHGCII